MDQTLLQIGLRIKEIREENGMTQIAFAPTIGIDNSTLAKIEKGKLGISKTAILEFISKYKVTHDWLMLGKPPKYANTQEVTVVGETIEDLLLKIYQNTLNSKAHEQATAEMVKEIYQKIMDKTDTATNARYSALFSEFLLEASRGR